MRPLGRGGFADGVLVAEQPHLTERSLGFSFRPKADIIAVSYLHLGKKI